LPIAWTSSQFHAPPMPADQRDRFGRDHLLGDAHAQALGSLLADLLHEGL